MGQIKVALFDCGGVIYSYSLKPFFEWLKTYSKEEVDVSFKKVMIGTQSLGDFATELAGKLKINSSPCFLDELKLAIQQGVQPLNQETLLAIDFLKKEKIKVGLLSNALPSLDGAIKNVPFDKGCVFPSYVLGLLKPDENIFKTVAKKLNINCSEILFVDDKADNIAVAQKMGMKTILFSRQMIVNQVIERVRS